MALVRSTKVVAENSSVAIGADNYGDITISSGYTEKQFEVLKNGIDNISAQLADASEVDNRDAIDDLLNSNIDEIADLIKQRKSNTALTLLEKLYIRVTATASGKIRFRIKANIGICHHINGNNEKASEYLLDAYAQAPNEPKAISNKVLALLLQGNSVDAFKFGKDQLTKCPTNDVLASYVIQASRVISEVKNPLEFIPKDLQNTSNVIFGLINFLQNRGEYGEWWKVAHKGAKLFPNDINIKKCSALANIEEILNPKKIENNFSLSIEENLILISAIAVLSEAWSISVNGEACLSDEDKINAINLANIFYFLHKNQDLTNLAEQSIKKCREDVEFLNTISQILLQSNLIDLAEKTLNELNPNQRSEFLLFRLAQAKANIKFLSNVTDTTIDEFPPSEQLCSRIVVQLSKLLELKISLTSEHFKPLLKLAGKNVRELLLIAQESKNQKVYEISEIAYKQACENFNPECNIANRLMLGREAYFRSDWLTVINALNGYISIHDFSDELKYLAVAFSNALPVQQIAINFFEDLPKTITSIQHIKVLSGVLFYNQGALPKAESILLSVLENSPEDLNALTCLINTYIRQNKEAEVKELIAGVNPNAVKGDPIFSMHLAQLMKKYGRQAEAIALGYRVLSEFSNDQKVISLYVGLLLLCDDNENLIPSSNTVQKGYWIQLTSPDSVTFDFLYEDDPVSHIPIKDLKHPLITSSIGKSLGETIEQDRRGFPPILWKISDIKHKYLHALHTNMEQYETNFPESNALFMVRLPDNGDISSILKIIKHDSEKKQEALNNYLGHKLPLEMLAKLISRDCDVISAAEMLLNNGIKIYTNSGANAELEAAISLIESNNFDTVVLDTYTCWHVAVTNLFPILLKVFKKIIVPQSLMDEIQFLTQGFDNLSSGEKMSISWRDGQYQRYISTEVDNQNRLTFINEQREKILKYCEIEVVGWVEKPNEITFKVMELAGAHFWDSAQLSLQPNRMLLSEDFFYRQWATGALDLKNSIWLDAILRYCFKVNFITIKELTEAIVHFSTWNHSHIALDSNILFSGFNLDETENLLKFSALSKYIGHEEAHFPSHIVVVKQFLQSIWLDLDNNKTKRIKATHIILDQLFRFSTEKALYIIILCYETQSEMEECIIEWRESVGITDAELVDAYNHMMTNQNLAT